MVHCLAARDVSPSRSRHLAGFAFSLGRRLTAAGSSIVGAAVAVAGSYPATIMAVSFIDLICMPLVPISRETARSFLPA